MERWEKIERVILVTLGVALLALFTWLFVTRGAFAIVILPFAFWLFWQAFFEDRLETNNPPTSIEKLAACSWLLFRRAVLALVGLCFSAMAFWILSHHQNPAELFGAAALAFLAFMAFWVSLFGGGRERSMSDDIPIHRRRKERYKWWF
jgi:hypothetical protein